MKKKELSESQKNEFANLIRNKLFLNIQKKTTIFLCGGDITKDHFGRFKLAQVLSRIKEIELFYPEDLFDDLLAGQGQHSLLSLENILAESVDAIVITPESPGSFAELGAFTNNENLSKKMICIQDNRYKSNKSFLNYGPIRLLKKQNSTSVIRCDFSYLHDSKINKTFYANLMKSITGIKRKYPVKQNVDNILFADRFILPCIYLMSEVNNVLLYDLLNKATNKGKVLCEIIVKSALSRLIKDRIIVRTTNGYHITDSGMQYVLEKFDRKVLDGLRLEMMNFKNRSQTALNYAKFKTAHP